MEKDAIWRENNEEEDGSGERMHFRENTKTTGHIIYTVGVFGWF